MTTVFLSGSRKIGRLNDMIRSRVQNMIDQGFHIIVGDANGADKAFQGYLAERVYPNVFIYCAGTVCRNNVGDWKVKKVQVDPTLKGRKFYTQKDKEMAAEADYGFVLWDGKSAGSIENVFELLKRRKRVVIYLSREKKFVNVSRAEDVRELFQSCDNVDYQNIRKKINLGKRFDDLILASQDSLNV